MKPNLSIILPVHNQADHIEKVVQGYLAKFKGQSNEIILVPNACSDDSPRLCRRLAKVHKTLRVVDNPKGGWGLSVRMGLRAARGRFLCYTNSARTDPATVAQLFSRARKRPEALFKIRRVARGHLLRETGSFLYNLECRWLLGTSSWDANGTPKIFQAQLLEKIKLTSEGDLLDAELLAQCKRQGIPLTEIPLPGWGRHGGKSTTRWGSAIRMYWGAFQLWRRMG